MKIRPLTQSADRNESRDCRLEQIGDFLLIPELIQQISGTLLE